jgi:hypothetical protein
MARIQKMDFCFGKLSFIELSALDGENAVVLAPYN